MHKRKLILLISLSAVLVFSMLIAPSCAAIEEPVVVEEPPVEEPTVEEPTVDEPPAEEVVEDELYSYESLREMAIEGEYVGQPAQGKTMAFANFLRAFPFCESVEVGIVEQWQLAGGSMDDLLVLDNAADPALAIENADIIFDRGPEVFLQFQLDAQVNAMIGRRAQELGVFIIAIDIPVPGFPFMGVDNYATAVLTGEWAAEQIEEVYGGIENVDRIFYLWNPAIGDEVALRVFGSMDVLREEYGDKTDPRTDAPDSISELVDAGSTTDEAQEAVADILAAYPDAENIIMFCLNDQAAAGVQAAAEIAGRWDPDNWMILSQGLDDLGKELVREGIIAGNSAYFPERYGEYLIPGALAHMYGNPVPSHLYVENVIITPENIDEYYPLD